MPLQSNLHNDGVEPGDCQRSVTVGRLKKQQWQFSDDPAQSYTSLCTGSNGPGAARSPE